MILRSCDAILSLRTPEGVLIYKDYPLLRVGEPVSTAITLEALAYGYTLNRNDEYILTGLRTLEYLLELAGSGMIVEFNAEQRRTLPGGAEFRQYASAVTAQTIGLVLRGAWPFLDTVVREGLEESFDHALGWTTRRRSDR